MPLSFEDHAPALGASPSQEEHANHLLTLSFQSTNPCLDAWLKVLPACCAEGRIEPEDGTLMCSYHGWRFQGDGKCTRVPQALETRAQEAACNSGRSCATSYPTQVCHKRRCWR